jgi:hypothetical protein
MMIIELTTLSGDKISVAIGFEFSQFGEELAWVSTKSQTFKVQESYHEIKAKLRQQRVNELAERLFVSLIANKKETISFVELQAAAFEQAEIFIGKMEKRNGNT